MPDLIDRRDPQHVSYSGPVHKMVVDLSASDCLRRGSEGVAMTGRKPAKVSADAIRRFADRSARTSAKLENRELPTGYVMSAKAKQYLAKRRQNA